MAIVSVGCGDRRAPPASQVAARVNKSEISVHQVNYALQRIPGAPGNPTDAVLKPLVDRLVTQQLAVDRAEELKLDLVPEVQQALQEARRDVLARAYFDRLTAGLPKPEGAEIAAFYDKRPELFAQRRIYTFQEIDVAASGPEIEALKKRLGETSVSAFAAYLRSSGVRHSSRLLNEPAENLALDLISRLAAMNEGQSIYLTRPNGLKVLVLIAAQPAPVSLIDATPAIKRFLANERGRAAVEQDLNAMRAAAKVEYFGRFVQVMAASDGAPSAATPAEAVASASSEALRSDDAPKTPGAK